MSIHSRAKGILSLAKRAQALFSMRTIRGGIDILRSGDVSFFISRLYEILIQSPIDARAIYSQSSCIEILTTNHTQYVAHLIQELLATVEIHSRILHALDDATSTNTLHIVICPNVFKKLPKHMIAFQMEQTTSRRWFTSRYINILRSKSIAIMDYSHSNLEFLTQQCRIPFQKMYYFPIGHSPAFRKRFLLPSRAIDREVAYDLVFYGAVNDRRRALIASLQQHFKILVISERYGTELYRELGRATAVINIHYYDPALLETPRIHECLALGYSVISEVAANQSEYAQGLADVVSIIDFTNFDRAVRDIRHTLDSIKQTSATSTDTTHDALCMTTEISRFYFLRMLVGLQIVDYAKLETVAPPVVTPKLFQAVCLSLPETPRRRSGAWVPAHCQVEYFDGVRHPLGWVGCALSYKFLAHHALKSGVAEMRVFEDDVEPVHLDSRTLTLVDDYLKRIDGEWDVFCGLITDLAESTSVTHCHQEGGFTFVHLDKMTGTVFNIYARTAMQALAEWTFAGADNTLTIDRYLEANQTLRVVTAYPFVAGHKDEMISTLWGFQNSSYRDWIARSQRRLAEKIDAFYHA